MNFVSGLISSAIAESPYFKLVQSGDFGPSREGLSMIGKKHMCCHICGETRATLLKDGEKDGNTIYICKDCKMLKPLDEEIEEND